MQRDRVHMLQQIQADIGKFLRCGHRGVAQRIIEHILVSDLGATGGAPSEIWRMTDFAPACLYNAVRS